jgi:hypothetical protein
MNPRGRTVWEDGGLVVTSKITSAEDWNGLADGRGGLTLFWDEIDGVHAQRFGADGLRYRKGNSVLMSTSTAVQPDAVPDAAGGTLVVWRQVLPGGRPVLMAQRLDTEGKPVWAAGGVRVSLRASSQTNPRVVYDNMSGMIVAWRDEANNASEMRIQRIDFQGNRLWTLEGLKITAPVGLTEFPIIAPLGAGEVVLAWNGQSGQTSQIFLQKVGPEPVLKWNNMTLASNVPIRFNRWNPALMGDENGGTWIAWEDFHDQNNYQIQLNHLHGDGKSVWPQGEITVAPAPGDQGKMTIGGNERDGIWLAWIDNRLSTIGLYVQEVGPDGKRLQGLRGRLIADGLSKVSKPQLITIAPGIAVATWVNRPKKGEWELSWSMVGAPSSQP